jgi:hypothetical protein
MYFKRTRKSNIQQIGINSKLQVPIAFIQEQVGSLCWAGPEAGLDTVGKKEIFMYIGKPTPAGHFLADHFTVSATPIHNHLRR